MTIATQFTCLEPTYRPWRASLELGLECTERCTILRRNVHEGPLRVQRALYPESDGTCHLYLLHPPGGLVQGDELRVEIEIGKGASCLVTTPGATKVYRSEGRCCRSTTDIRVDDGGVFEWLPQETILFDGARVVAKTSIELADDASFIGWDVTCLGRPATDEVFSRGFFDQTICLTRRGVPLLAERLVVRGGAEMLAQAWGCDGSPVIASMTIATPRRGIVDLVRAAGIEEVWGSELEGVTVFRCGARHADRAKRQLTRVWDVVRPFVLRASAHHPRIWLT